MRHPESLSARRAWIEMSITFFASAAACVALRKESVDRNSTDKRTGNVKLTVALRKESVDRNHCRVSGAGR